MTGIIMLIIMLFMIGVVLTYFSRLGAFESYIKENEAETWESLGKPGGIKDMFFPIGIIKIFIFLFKGKHESFNDPVAKQKAIALKNTIILFFVGFTGLVIFTMHPYILAVFA